MSAKREAERSPEHGKETGASRAAFGSTDCKQKLRRGEKNTTNLKSNDFLN